MARSNNTVRFRGRIYAGLKIGLADYLSIQPNSEAKPVSLYDIMFTVAKSRFNQSALGYKTKIANYSTSVINEVSIWKLANGNRICKFRKEKPTVEGEKSCYNKAAKSNAEICIRHRSRDKLCRRSLGSKNRLLGATTTYSNRRTKSIYRTEQDRFISMDKSKKKFRNFCNDTQVLRAVRMMWRN